MSKELHTLKIFSTIFTLSYSKILDKNSKHSLAKLGLISYYQELPWEMLIMLKHLWLIFTQWIPDYMFKNVGCDWSKKNK